MIVGRSASVNAAAPVRAHRIDALLAAREPALQRARRCRARAARRRRAPRGRASSAAISAASRSRLRIAGRRRVDEHERPAGRRSHDARGVGPGHEQRHAASRARAWRRARPRTASRPSSVGVGAHDLDAQVGRRIGQVDAEQEAHEPLGGLRAALGQRHRGVAVGDAQRAARAQPAGAVEAREHVGRREAGALEQARDQPRAGQAPGEVVVQVAVQPPVARVQLGRRAQRQHAGLELAQAAAAPRPCRGGRRDRRRRSPCASRTAASSER